MIYNPVSYDYEKEYEDNPGRYPSFHSKRQCRACLRYVANRYWSRISWRI